VGEKESERKKGKKKEGKERKKRKKEKGLRNSQKRAPGAMVAEAT
jgi:hypothetical protein